VDWPWVASREVPSRLVQAAEAPLRIASFFYGLGAVAHRSLYDGRWKVEQRLSCRVVSVGSLVAGGAGKTPMAAWLASGLRARGSRVALASRGYGRSGRAVETLSDGKHVVGDVSGVGDEPLVLAAHARGVPVLVGRDRTLVGLRAISTFGIDTLVLDDGFQHYRLARDLDVVTVDGASGFGNRRLLPAGPLRERPAALSRAHAVGVIDPPAEDAPGYGAFRSDLEFVAERVARPFRFRAVRRPSHVRPIAGTTDARGASRVEPPESLAGARVGILAALGQPDSFRRTVEGLGATVVASRTFRDHHRYAPRDLHDLHRLADVWITTEKDAVKILPGWAGRIDLRVLAVELVVEGGDALLDWVEQSLQGPGS
jgi:tetraacyldisaccharide 4'-kinase